MVVGMAAQNISMVLISLALTSFPSFQKQIVLAQSLPR
jgi:hypothetical protein